MARLDTFKNPELKNKSAVMEMVASSGLIVAQDERAVTLAAKEVMVEHEEKEPSLRHQMLRWYNANPDMLDIACRNAIRQLAEKAAKGEMFEFSSEYRQNEHSLSSQPENFDVLDITFLEEFMFKSYPLLVSLHKYSRPEGYKPKHLITENIENINIFELINALVELSRTEKSPIKSYDYAELLDVLTC